MKIPDSGQTRKHLRLSDIRGVAQLATQATSGVTGIVEGVHRSVLGTAGLASSSSSSQTRGITSLVYRSIRSVTQWLGAGLEATMSGLEYLLDSDADVEEGTPQREVFLAALNGVMGDRLVASNNPFAIPMTLRYRNEVLDGDSMPAASEVAGKILLLVHGLCMNDLHQHAQYNQQMPDHGALMELELGYTPVYLRYNSGMHTSHNGRDLSDLLEDLISYWPVPVEQLSIVAHSMGGLVSRSALHYARMGGLSWPDHLKSMVFLGTPHHGAPLERAGNWLDVLLGSTPYSRPFTSLGQLRSSGITDLRHGNVLDEDWLDLDRFEKRSDQRHVLPLPAGVTCHTVAATTAGKRNILADRLIGDGLVPLYSALGRHDDARRCLMFEDELQYIAYKTNHMQLLNSAEVSRQILRWLAAD